MFYVVWTLFCHTKGGYIRLVCLIIKCWRSYLDLTGWGNKILTAWCRVLLEKLTGLQLVKKFPAFHGTWRFITALTSFRHLSLSWASPIQSIDPHPSSWRSILILSTHLRLGLPGGLFPSGFPTKILYTPLSSSIRATCPAHFYTADSPTTVDSTTATFCRRHCCPNYTRTPSNSNTQTKNTFKQNPILFEKTAYEGKWDEISPSYFYPKKNTCPPPFHLNNKQVTQTDDVKYLDIYLDRKLTWHKQISTKRKQLDVILRTLYWSIGRKSQPSLANKLLVYKAILKHIWTYCAQLWGSASDSKIEYIGGFQ